MVEVGNKAPGFSLPASGGKTASSAELGRTVLYFYPKADTSGCTKQAQDFQAALPHFAKHQVSIIGVSRDPVSALDKFAKKYGLTFPLASDAEGTLSEAYGVWVEKSMYGRKYMGLERATFLISADGHVEKIWRKVKVPGHVEAVAAAI